MARDHAQIRLDMWGDDDWRALTVPAQHLYMLLLTSPSLSFCGVADWRPARIAPLAAGWSADDVRQAAQELTGRLFLVIDEDTEEVLIRSFVRHDGLMKQPNMATAMATAHGAIASPLLRGVVVHELRRLHGKQPELAGWKSPRALAVLERNAVDPSVGASVDPSPDPPVDPSPNPSVDPSVKGSDDPNPKGSVDPCPTPAPTPAPTPPSSNEEGKSAPRKRATPAPDRLDITDAMQRWATDKAPGVDLDRETARFLDHHRAKGSTFKDWTAAWRTWMSRSADYGQPRLVTAIPTDRRLTAGELENLLGPDVWSPPDPPPGMGPDQAWEWQRDRRLEHIEERQQQARQRLGRTA